MAVSNDPITALHLIEKSLKTEIKQAMPPGPAPIKHPDNLVIQQTANGYIALPHTDPGYAIADRDILVFYTVDDLALYLKRHFDDHTTLGPEDFTNRTC